ncbi:hypothetical protein SAMN05444000_106128 [Shimia gijangensis]|uniref:DUF3757 domain-containing protein n=2 Tax=Shimia gijangensis TaxID=1470563 RepID=A0A1M6HRP2_9RHOB|nr:hypothetical protein SAMN05444000_106128 [Shimia gijangensis]
MLALGLIAVSNSAFAAPPLTCEGYEPDWFLTLTETQAQIRFGRKTDFEIPQSNIAEGQENWPRAYTLIADFDTAIVLVNEVSCALAGREWPITAHVLTQRGQTPILLTGCCTVAE